MSDPWHILGLSRDSATEKDVKSAYARLIRQHRPDADPEGFQRVRQAYEAALASLKSRAEDRPEMRPTLPPMPLWPEPPGQKQEPDPKEAEPPPRAPLLPLTPPSGAPPDKGEAEPPPVAPLLPLTPPSGAPPDQKEAGPPPLAPLSPQTPPSSAPPELVEAELAVFKARDEEGPVAMDKAMARLYPLCRSLRPGKAGFQLWYESMHRVTEGRSMLVARGVTIPQLIDEMESGGALITHAVVAHWEAVRNTERLHALADAMMTHAARLGSRESAVVALRLAMEIGFVYPRLAGTLVTFAFPHVDRRTREQLVAQVEHQASIGSMMAGLRSDQIAFWHERVRNPNHTWDWNNKASQDALEYLAKRTPPQWNGFGIVRQIASPEWFARLEQEMSRRPRASVPPPLSRPRVQKSGGGNIPLGRAVWLIFVLLGVVGRAIPGCSDHRQTVSNSSVNWQRKLAPSRPSSSQGTSGSKSAEAAAVLARARVEKLLKEDNVLHIWVDGIHAVALPAQAKYNKAAQVDRVKVGGVGIKEVHDMMLQFQRNNPVPSRQGRLLEAMLFNHDSTPIEVNVALTRMCETQQPASFLPLWEAATPLGPRMARQISLAASTYLKANDMRLPEMERARMEKLVQPQP